MVDSIDRYKKLVTAVLAIRDLSRQIKRQLTIVSQCITAHELQHRDFHQQSASTALCELASEELFVLEKDMHVESKLLYKEEEICLHVPLPTIANADCEAGAFALQHILKELDSTDILKS